MNENPHGIQIKLIFQRSRTQQVLIRYLESKRSQN